MAESLIEIEVVYATVDRQVLLTLAVSPGTSVRSAALSSGLATHFPEVDLASCPLGIFGKVVANADARIVRGGDRIEIYRPLLADPKEIRRLRAVKAAQAKQRNA